MRFAGRSLYALGQLVVLRLPNLIVLMLLTRFQGASAAGLFGLAVTYLILLTAWWVGLDELVIRETARAGGRSVQPDRDGTRRAVYAYGFLRVGVASLLYLAVVGFLWLNQVYQPAEWRFIAVLLLSSVADGFTGSVQAGLVGRQRFGHAFSMSAVQTVLRIGLVAAAIALDLGLLAIAWAWTAGAGAGVLVALIALHAVIPAGARDEPGPALRLSLRHWTSEGWAFLVIGIVATLEYQQDIIILSAYQPLAAVGYYSVATTLFAAVALPVQALRTVLFPHMARAAAQDQAGGDARPDVSLRDLHAYSLQWLLAVGLLCAFLGFVYAPPLITLLFGANMLPSVLPARLLMVALVFFALNVPQSRFLLATGRQNRTAALITISTGANLIANLVLARLYGAPGAALARNISTALYLALALFSLAGAIRRPVWPALLAPFLALAIAGAVAYLLTPWPWWLAAALSGAAYLAVLAAILKLTNTWKPLPSAADAIPGLPG
jgi:O-antigen/teichoic acid export membrane protein